MLREQSMSFLNPNYFFRTIVQPVARVWWLTRPGSVQHSPQTPLQILAGPGSGKTKASDIVLTSRIAHLILHHHLPASSICAVTFTNKAANEMKVRLTKVIGKEKTSEVRMGTFHALCALFLRKYARSILLDGNFTICDAEESKKIVSPLLKKYKDDLAAKDISLKEGTVLALISKAKAKGLSSRDFLREVQARNHGPKDSNELLTSSTTVNDIDFVVAEIYDAYEKTLRKNNSLDFDDLLLFGVKLFTTNLDSVKWCQHVLVDEFQDTNVTQYDLMKAIAYARCVTVVGDPDQSIYGWRSAEVGNLARMRKDFSSAEQIFLEQNYRSTASILQASLAIVAEDKTRIQKSLHTSHPVGPTPVLRSFSSEQMEALFFAGEIKRIVAHMGGVLNWGDFVILLRFNALSRTIESALQKEGIPSRVLNGHKFFERVEIKDLLAYLQLVDNPQFVPAFVRAINTPARGMGEKSVAKLLARADVSNLTLVDLAEKIHSGTTSDIKPAVKRKIGPFVSSIRILKQMASENARPSDLIRRLVELISYEDHLRKTQPDWESRWENVQELITFASDVQSDWQDGLAVTASEDAQTSRETPLRLFLQASMLSSEGDQQSKEAENEKVTISTCHSAKGLEWPVVMVPAVEQGTFPFYRTDDVEEERRLLYVACTRAQSLLYLSYATQRKVSGETKTRDLSPFVSSVIRRIPSLFVESSSKLLDPDREVICQYVPSVSGSVFDVHLTRFTSSNKSARSRFPEYSTYNNNATVLNAPSYIAPSTDYNMDTPPFVNFTSAGSSKLHPTSVPSHMSYRGSSLSSSIASSAFPPSSARSVLPNLLPHRTSLLRGIQHTLKPATTSEALEKAAPVIPTVPVAPASSEAQTVVRPLRSSSNTSTPPHGPEPTTGFKRRLGMGRLTTGYANKKFKPPT
ncbi:P-loop containing nucleoside triphosphate hydrolase protein [Lentinula aff. lateritia]|uniref:P-loop containing nucleoside triphosphate hydrolase protein n=1 Tax=Lentinula aff. lateritia TaxID=2804960 RepID=A0ACC1TW65_9AGAR|nr:P-loop containing nucleoside triphosphate hydrolase protein [Lentinula aff. lateritia]